MLPETDFWILYQEMAQRTAALMQEQFVSSSPGQSVALPEQQRKPAQVDANPKTSIHLASS
jgi:hypothetical protein